MQPSPLSFNHYQLLDVEIRREPDYQTVLNAYPNIGNAELQSRVSFGKKDGEENDFTVKLYLNAAPKKEGGFPYIFNLSVQGFFTLPEDFSAANKEEFVLINGASLLYGVLRDTLLNLSSRFEYGAVMLPTVNFLNLKGALDADQDEK